MPLKYWIIGSLVVVGLMIFGGVRGMYGAPAGNADQGSDHSSMADADEPAVDVAEKRPHKFPVTVRHPSGPPLIELKHADPLGRVGRVSCSTCHSIRPPNLANRRPSDLRDFHQNMEFAHGQLTCYSCHNPDDSETLRLADETKVEYANVMKLCAQCHGAHAKKYERGYHGGMSGYWDLTRGARVRNNCVDCHDPHVPKFPMMRPTFKPRERFLKPPHEQTHSVSEAQGGRHE